MRPADKKEVLLAVSGGIDSAIAIYLLQNEGFTVHGVHFGFWHWEAEKLISNSEIFERIKEIFGVDIQIIDFRQNFKKTVVDQFVADQRIGLTPNPCVRCNPMVKFQFLMDIADQANIQYIATGHYARVSRDPELGKYLLRTGLDQTKDQSYMLCYLTQEILARTIFPLGNYEKKDIYDIGQKLGLPISQESESQDMCFVQPENYTHFLNDYFGDDVQGDIVDTSGQIIGQHHGLHHYTIGQRKGIRLSAAVPYYVIRKNVSTNTLTVGIKEDLNKFSFVIDQLNWIGQIPRFPYHAAVKIRYRSKQFPAMITDLNGEQFQVTIKEPIQGVTPGQYAVFYENDVVTGGGRIIR
jgi:tRNA-uridine 2-sulfurtransferase